MTLRAKNVACRQRSAGKAGNRIQSGIVCGNTSGETKHWNAQLMFKYA